MKNIAMIPFLLKYRHGVFAIIHEADAVIHKMTEVTDLFPVVCLQKELSADTLEQWLRDTYIPISHGLNFATLAWHFLLGDSLRGFPLEEMSYKSMERHSLL